jgi:hypothetical protein
MPHKSVIAAAEGSRRSDVPVFFPRSYWLSLCLFGPLSFIENLRLNLNIKLNFKISQKFMIVQHACRGQNIDVIKLRNSNMNFVSMFAYM